MTPSHTKRGAKIGNYSFSQILIELFPDFLQLDLFISVPQSILNTQIKPRLTCVVAVFYPIDFKQIITKCVNKIECTYELEIDLHMFQGLFFKFARRN